MNAFWYEVRGFVVGFVVSLAALTLGAGCGSEFPGAPIGLDPATSTSTATATTSSTPTPSGS